MPDILHKVGINASPDAVYKALATLNGLSGWWTADATGDSNPGGVIHFRFGDRGFIDMEVTQSDPGKRVLWRVVGGPDAWIGTKVGFDLVSADGFTAVLFKHQDWKAPNEFMHHCSTKWAMFLMSLKALIETGSGAPYPNDVHVSLNGD